MVVVVVVVVVEIVILIFGNIKIKYLNTYNKAYTVDIYKSLKKLTYVVR